MTQYAILACHDKHVALVLVTARNLNSAKTKAKALFRERLHLKRTPSDHTMVSAEAFGLDDGATFVPHVFIE